MPHLQANTYYRNTSREAWSLIALVTAELLLEDCSIFYFQASTMN